MLTESKSNELKFNEVNFIETNVIKLKEKVYNANIRLKTSGLVVLTWGNVSQIDREMGVVAIKPSGVSYDTMKPCDIVIVDLDGKVIDGNLSPSSDLPTHLEIYKKFQDVGGVTHTHSRWATVFAQAGLSIPALGTTHADTFYGIIPVTRKLTGEEIKKEYERETGKVIVETFKGENPMSRPAVLVNNHGPFTFGESANKSVENAIILEEVAFMAYHTLILNSKAEISKDLQDKHYLRKHGDNAYYGQKG